MSRDDQAGLRTQVAELLVVRASAHASDAQRNYPLWEETNQNLKRLLGEGVGGVILFGGSSTELIERCKTLRKWALNPLLLCADVEEGLGQRFQGGTWLVPPMALGQIYLKDAVAAIKFAERYGRCIGSQARQCGLNWVLAPVCDVNTNSANPVINVRAWGEDPAVVSALVCAFHRGLASEGVLSCVKHFPGHGDTGLDSHIDLPALDHDLHRLEEVELVPFRSAIAAGVGSVMTGHLLMKKFDADHPATISKKIISELLRKNLGFEGIVVTDALVMKAISKTFGPGEAAVMALEAGVDVILMPASPDEAIQAICKALLSGRIPMDRLHQALIMRRKFLAYAANDMPLLSSLSTSNSSQCDELESHEDRQLSKELVRKSIRIRNSSLVQSINNGINLLRIDGVFPCPILENSSPAIALPEAFGYKTILYHKMGVSPWQENSDAPLDLDRLGEGPVFLQLFIRGNPFLNGREKSEPWLSVVEQLQSQNLLAGLVLYGSPYLWADFCNSLKRSIPAAYSPGQMPEAQRQVLEALFKALRDGKDFRGSIYEEFTD